MKLIHLDAVLAEIEKRIVEYKEMKIDSSYYEGMVASLEFFRDEFIDTSEVKEVDLDFTLHEYWNISPKICVDCLESATMTKDEMINFAKHFFELGLNESSSLTWEDINSILYIERLVLREFGGQEHSNEELCREVLKRFKAQKGEKV